MIIYLYKILPTSLIKFLAKSRFFLPLKKLLLYNRNEEVFVSHEYNGIKVEFYFTAPVKIAAKAKYYGIENTIIKNLSYFVEKKDPNGDGAILDVGVNYGYLFFSWSKMFPKRSIIGFEVHPDIYQIISAGIKKNFLTNAFINNKAVHNVNGTLTFDLESKTAILNDNNGLTTLESVTLDSVGTKKVVGIKIDTDGNDLNCLLGAQNLVQSMKPVIAIETNGDTKILDFLWDNGYVVVDMNRKIVDKHNYDIKSNNLCNVFGIPSLEIL